MDSQAINYPCLLFTNTNAFCPKPLSFYKMAFYLLRWLLVFGYYTAKNMQANNKPTAKKGQILGFNL